MRKFLEIGGLVAGVVLIAFGAAAIAMSIQGRSTVSSSLKQEQIVGTPDMTPAAIKAEAAKAGLDVSKIDFPTQSVAGKAITTGALARTFAEYMRVHALEATGGQVFSQMPRYATANGKGTNDAAVALKGSNGQPVANPTRDVWYQETALTTALNSSYMASQLALFGIVVGVALVLSGFGFAILALGGALRNPATSLVFMRRWMTEHTHHGRLAHSA